MGQIQIILPLLLALLPVGAYIGPDGHCWIDVFAAFTTRDGSKAVGIFNHTDISIGWASMVAAALAVEHFNARNASLVPQLGDSEIQTCNVKLQIDEVFDTGFDSHRSGRLWLQRLLETNFTIPLDPNQNTLCAIAGPSHDTPADDLNSLAFAARIPMVATHSSRVVRSGDGWTRSSVYPDLLERSVFITSFLLQLQRDNYIALLYPLSDWGLQIRTTLGLLFDNNNMIWMASEFLSINNENDHQGARSMWSAVQRIKKSGFRTIVLAIEDDLALVSVADACEEMEMLGGGYFFISFAELGSNINTTDNVDKLSIGAAELLPLTRDMYEDGADPLLSTWANVNQSFANEMNQLNPIAPQSSAFVNATLELFQNRTEIEYGASFMYDAIMAIGFGACQAKRHADGSVSGSDHFAAIQKTSFYGATGTVYFGQTVLSRSGTRPGDSMLWAVVNWYLDSSGEESLHLPDVSMPFCDPKFTNSPCLEPSSDYRLVDIPFESGSYNFTWVDPTFRWLGANLSDDWVPFVYAGNTTTPPPLRSEGDPNYIPSAFRVVGLSLMALTMTISVLIAAWVFVCRKHRILAAAQPIFLYIICAGCILQSSTVFTRSFDEGAGWSKGALDRCCMAMPWLFVLGQIIISSALFSKLWRVHQTLQFSRKRVGYLKVVLPMVVLMLLAVLILSLWTSLNPLQWEREVTDEEENNTVGSCAASGDTPLAAYLVPLAIVLVAAGALMAYMAWRTRDVDETYSESQKIGLLLLVQLEVLLVAAPVLMRLNNDFATTGYAVFVAVILTFPNATLGFVFGHKIRAYRRAIRGMDENKRKRGEHGGATQVTGIDPPSGPTPQQEEDAGSSPAPENKDTTEGSPSDEGVSNPAVPAP